jgi:carbonic anhydrase
MEDCLHVDNSEARTAELITAPIGRRGFLVKAGALGATAAIGAVGLSACSSDKPTPAAEAAKPKHTAAPEEAAKTAEAKAPEGPLTPDQAMAALVAGNARFVAMKQTHPDLSNERRTEVAKGQHPFACVIGCIDSRVAPEQVFDQGLGDLLTARVGAAIGDDSIIGSTEFGVEEFHIPLVVVLGHERCGAVKATLEAVKAGVSTVPGQIGAVVGPIIPAVKEVLGKGGDELDNAVRAVVKNTVASLNASPVLATLIQEKKVKVVGARYDLDSGAVEFIS